MIGQKLVINTRPLDLQSELSELLNHSGFSVFEFPGCRVEGEVQGDTFQALETKAREGDFLLFTSPRGVEAVFPALSTTTCRDLLPKLRVAVIGEQTQATVERLGHSVEFAFRARDSKEFAELLLPLIEGKRIFLFQGSDADTALAEELDSVADEVFRRVVYRMGEIRPSAEICQSFADNLLKGMFFALIFGSSDAVRRSVSLAREIGGEALLEQFRQVPVAVIGRKTKATAEEFGFEVAWMPKQPSFQALVEILKDPLRAHSFEGLSLQE